MGSRMIDIFNSTISQAINKVGDFYKSWIGSSDYTSITPIIESEDVNCGAICNELEFAREQSGIMLENLQIDSASGDELDVYVNAMIDLPRRGSLFESDATYRNRFKFLVTDKVNTRRITKWSIRDALTYFISDASKIQIIEHFDTTNLYFQVRLEGTITFTDTLFLDNFQDQGYLRGNVPGNNNFLGGFGIGEVFTFLKFLIDRVKAAGVDYDIYVVDQQRFTKDSDAIIGSVQMSKTSDAHIFVTESFTKLSDGEIVIVIVDDWYLPSEDEVEAIFDELIDYGIGDWVVGNFSLWSSTEINATTARRIWVTGYGHTRTWTNTGKNYVEGVRPCRQFISTKSYSLRDRGPGGGWIFYKSGNNYMECAPQNASDSHAWSNVTASKIGVTAQGTAIGTGDENTTAIVGQIGHTDSAAQACLDYIPF